jgi:hypothetical protein
MRQTSWQGEGFEPSVSGKSDNELACVGSASASFATSADFYEIRANWRPRFPDLRSFLALPGAASRYRPVNSGRLSLPRRRLGEVGLEHGYRFTGADTASHFPSRRAQTSV